MTSTIIVLFNLKPDASESDYRRFVLEQDVPGVKALGSVADFRVQKATSVLGGGTSPYQFVEIIEVRDMAAFGQDVATSAVQAVAAKFREFAESPIFIVTEAVV